MKRKNLFLMCGCPGSGKTHWIKQKLSENPDKATHISRDIVRFSMVAENEDYFSREDEVFNEFIRYIKEALIFYDDVYVDATHINEKSRNKVLDKLPLDNVNIIPVNFEVPIEICCQRNNLRQGREKVPDNAILRMHRSFRPATNNEKHHYKTIITIKE